MGTTSSASVRQWLRRYEVRPKKRWGQTFLTDPRVPARLLELWDLKAGLRVLEIGAGAGALTLPLLARGLKVVAVERDRLLCRLLRDRVREECPGTNLCILEQDILTLDPGETLMRASHVESSRGPADTQPQQMAGEKCVPIGTDFPDRWVLVGNLPYAITGSLLKWVVRNRGWFSWASLMLQREVALRLMAAPGSKAYGSLTLWVGFHFRVEKELAVDAASFWPMPKVTSLVLRLTPRAKPPVDVPSGAMLETVVRAAFSHRRKVLAGSLARGLGVHRRRVEDALSAAGIGPRLRAEECSLEDFAALTRSLAAGWAEEGETAWHRKE
ncbi:MAG: 16S rRNA (adenine(1518)-N(6)/adenine(1519)-N(6))-dimethyltransferase [Candidatus Eisenbacteria sp.]|nr:16S rRNA (adenine(1518)-N(6)/adenine(1519)-N(6))-dimethyltransferase [Candidatus Eisenbacteria bacterium]